MTTCLPAALLALGIAIVAPGVILAAEIKVLSIPFKGPLDRIGPQFQRATGHGLAVRYAPSEPLQKLINGGEPFDVVLIFPTVVDQLIARGKVGTGTRVDIARAGLGVAVRKGAAKPDLRTTEGFKHMLLASTSIVYASQGPSGVHLLGLLDQLAIAPAVKPKLRPMSAGSLVVGPVARGEAEIGIVSIPFILENPGVDLAGPLPRDLQDYVHYSSGIGFSAEHRTAAQDFVSYLTQAESLEILRANGLEAPSAR